jgi:hypothetical protein
MYISNSLVVRKLTEGGPRCVSTADNCLPGEEDIIATPGSVA